MTVPLRLKKKTRKKGMEKGNDRKGIHQLDKKPLQSFEICCFKSA